MQIVFENEQGRYLTVTKMAYREDEVWFTADISMAKLFTLTIRQTWQTYSISIEPRIPSEALRVDIRMVPVSVGVSLTRSDVGSPREGGG